MRWLNSPLLRWLLLAMAAGPAAAQQSVQPLLDACVRAEQRDSSVVGSVLGALSGFSVGFSRGGTTRETHRGIGISAVAGGALGQASAYFKAVCNCFEKNPSWVPASRLERGESYKVAMVESGYAPADGIVVLATGIDMPDQARPETRLEIKSRFMLLTPDGAEARVRIERKLFVVADGQEAALTLPAQASELHTLPAGEHWDLVSLPIPKEAPLGVSYRFEFHVSVPERPASAVRAAVKVL